MENTNGHTLSPSDKMHYKMQHFSPMWIFIDPQLAF